MAEPQEKPAIRVLMVCLGNICRSPTAHGVLVKYIDNKGLSKYIEVDSAGTGDWHIGEKPDPRSIAAASQRGYALDSLRARQVEREDYHLFDYILAMDGSNLQELQRNCPPAQQSKLGLLLDFGDSDLQAVPDPYYSGDSGFELVLDLVEEACQRLLEQLCQQHFPELRD